MKIKRRLGINFLASVFLFVLGINFIQAYGGSFRYVSQQDLYLTIAFIVGFFIFNIGFSKFLPEKQKKISWVPALALAIGTTYGLWRTNFNAEVFTSQIGLSGGFLQITAIILGIALIIYVMSVIKKKFNIKFKTNVFFVLLGMVFLLLGLSKTTSSVESSILIGSVLIIIGVFPALQKWFGKPKNKN